MKNNLLLQDYEANSLEANQIYQVLEIVKENLQKEIFSKQNTIKNQEEQIKILLNVIKDKNTTIKRLSKKLIVCQQNAEGHRQLFNKLINDISRLQQDIEWYKRTYEKRSLLGTIREKLRRKI